MASIRIIDQLIQLVRSNPSRAEATSFYLHHIIRLSPLLLFLVIIYPIVVSKVIALETFVLGDIELWESAETLSMSFFTVWHDSPDGGSFKIVFPFVFIKALLVAVFGQLAAAKMFLLLLIPSAMISMFYSSKIFVSSLTGRYLAAFVYAINPITIGEFISASPLLAFYAILPLVLYTFVRLLEAKSDYWRNILQFSLTFSFAIILLIDSIIMLPVWLSIITLIYFLTHRKNLFPLIRKLSVAVSIIFVMLLPIVIGYSLPASELGETISARGLSNPLGDVQYTYNRAHFLNLVKLAGNEGTHMAALGYNNPNQLWNITGLVIPIVAFSFLAFTKDVKKLYLLLSLLAIAIFILLFVWATKEHYTFSLFEGFPMLFTLRNPRKIMFVLSLAVSLLFAFGATHIISRIGTKLRRKYISAVLVCVIMALLLAYNWPLFTNDLGMGQARPGFPGSSQISENYIKIAEDLHSLSYDEYRTIWLPMDVKTQYIVTGLETNSFLLPSGSGLTHSSPEYYNKLFNVLLNKETNEWGKWLSAVNVKYVVVNKLSDQQGEPILSGARWDTLYPMGDPLKYYDLLKGQADLVPVIDNENYAIFENLEYSSIMTVYHISALEYVKSDDAVSASNYILSEHPLKLAKLSESQYHIQGNVERDLIIVISTNYDPMWKSSKAEITEHFKAFNWANGFVIEAGSIDGSIQYTFQQTYAITAIIAYSVWIVAIIALLRPWPYVNKILRLKEYYHKL